MAIAGEFQVERAPRPEEIAIEASREQQVVRRATGIGAGLLLGSAALVAIARRTGAIRRRRRHGAARVVGRTAGLLGRGLFAGVAGTAAITAAAAADQLAKEALDARKEKRKAHFDVPNAIVSPWSFSAGVVGKVLGIEAKDAEHERRLSMLAHWEYGSNWGLSLAAMRALGIRGLAAMGLLLAGQLGAEMVVMPALDLFSPPSQWGRRAIVSSVVEHAIYAIAAVSAFERLRPDES